MEQKFFIEGPAGKLEARSVGLYTPSISESKTIIGIVCHPHPLYQGTMDNKVVTTIAKAWKHLGLATVRFNFRGVGESEGKYGEGKGELEDLLAVIQWVKKVSPDSKLWLAGFSFGSVISFQAASQLTSQATFQAASSGDPFISALLSVAPPVHHFKFENLNLPRCPWIIIQGDQDEIVPVNQVIELVERQKKNKSDLKLFVMKGATHFFHGRLIEVQNLIEKEMKPFLGI